MKGQRTPLKIQAELLGLNRSQLYYKPRCASEEKVALKREIDEIFTECPFYGSRRKAKLEVVLEELRGQESVAAICGRD